MKRFIQESRSHGYWIAFWSVVGWIGTASAPLLADHPLLLMLLAPRTLFVALATDSTSFVPFVLLGTLRLCVADASYFVLGRKLPTEFAPVQGAHAKKARRAWQKMIRRLDSVGRWFCSRPRLAGVFLFVRPNAKYLAVAGAYGVRPLVAGVSATVGTIAYLSVMHLGVSWIF